MKHGTAKNKDVKSIAATPCRRSIHSRDLELRIKGIPNASGMENWNVFANPPVQATCEFQSRHE
jgi:hypothetical protein